METWKKMWVGVFFWTQCICSSNFVDSKSFVTICNQFPTRKLNTWRHRARDHSTRHRPLGLPTYRRSIITKSLSPAVSEILGRKRIGVTTLTFQSHVTSSVTWPFDSQVPISYRRSMSPNRYLQPFSRYWPLSVLGSRPWPFMVAWRQRSCDHLIPR